MNTLALSRPLLAALSLACTLLVACSTSTIQAPAEPHNPQQDTTQSSTNSAVQDPQSSKETTTPDMPPSAQIEPTQPSESTPCTPPVPGAYPCAGQGIPDDAQPLTTSGFTLDKVVGTLTTPTGNIACDVWPEGTRCLALNWGSTMNPNREPYTPGIDTVALGTSSMPTWSQQSEALFALGLNEAEVPKGAALPYGTVWYHGDFFFASEEDGLTFWNSKSGHGAFINRSTAEFF